MHQILPLERFGVGLNMTGIVITFVVPAYNSAATLANCLDSFIDESLLPHMEVLVINDGSSDSTAEIASDYVNQYSSFKLVNKENGGHGSVINHAAKIATGKYFKVVDSDDKVQTNNLRSFMESLSGTDADVVFTNFRTIDSRNGNIREYAMSDIPFEKKMSFDEFWSFSNVVRSVCNFHGITYKTLLYKGCGLLLSEQISYEDQEYSTFPIIHVSTVMPLNLFLYEYSLGDAGQSVSDVNQVKKFDQMLHVFWRLVRETPQNLTDSAKSYFSFKKREKLLSCYVAALVKNPNKKDGRKQIKNLRNELKAKDLTLYTRTEKQYLVCLFLSFIGFTGETLTNLQKNRFYRFFVKKMH